LAYVALSGAIVVSRADGSQPQVLTDAGTYDAPQWSPDGDRVAFVRELGASADDVVSWVYVIGRDGKGSRRVARAESAAWLPDGAGLLIQRMTEIFALPLEGKPRRLARGWGPLFPGRSVALAPSGERIAYLRGGCCKTTIYVTGTRGGPEHKVLDVRGRVPGEAVQVGDLAWSSDGQALFGIWSLPRDGDEVATLHEVAPSGSSRVVVGGVNPYAGIAVSPRGDRVAFVGRQGLEVVDLETGTSQPLVRTSDPGALTDPKWSPDGSTLAYLTTLAEDVQLALETIRVDGAARKRVSAPGESVESFSWRPAESDE
jgi:Tol biopolymer transport system component